VIVTLPDLTGAECGDIAITAAEGGIGYWSIIDAYRFNRWQYHPAETIWGYHECQKCLGDVVEDIHNPDTDDDFGRSFEVPDDFVFYAIHEDIHDDGTYRGGPFDITPALIRRGFELGLTEARPDLIKRLLSLPREDWTGEIDSTAADVIIQLGALGEIRYG
jgi:hypothetical protein